MKPYLREKTSFDFEEVPSDTSFEAGYLVTKNSGWRSIRPVVNTEKCVGCMQCTSNLGTFTAGADMTVYVALDSRVTTIPEWLTSWKNTGLTVTNSNSVVFELYSLDVSKGDTVILGTNGQSSGCVCYSVFAVEQGAGYIMGDVNMDGMFNVADAVLLQKWLLAVPDTTLANWKAGDLISDNKLDVFDLVMMKRALIEQMEGEK